MADPDELLARADERLAPFRPYQYGHDGWLIHHLAAALRAALAARPQPLVQVGWFEDPEQAAISLRYHQQTSPPEPPFPDGVPIFVRQSDLQVVAGSATPTEGGDDG